MLINDYAELIWYLRQVRITQGLGRRELADVSGISKSAIDKYEQGIHAMNMPKLMKYLNALGCHLVLVPEEALDDDLAKLIDSTVGEYINWSLIHRNRRRGVPVASKRMPRFLEKEGKRRRGFAKSASKKLEESRKRGKTLGHSSPHVLNPNIRESEDAELNSYEVFE